MSTDDEKFFAWLDGELSEADALEMEARVALDPRLSKLAEQHRALGARLKSAFDVVSQAPVPGRLAAAAHPQGVVDFAAARRERVRWRWAPLPQWAAIAATLVLGVGIGTLVRQPASTPVELQGGRIYAASGLRQALDSELASAPAGGDVRIGITFRDSSGSICRSFTGSQSSGLACRDGDRWRVRGLFSAPEGQGTDYRMAAGMDPNLAALVDSTMAGEPFDAAAEKSAKQHGWR
jgi:hypothetical protein